MERVGRLNGAFASDPLALRFIGPKDQERLAVMSNEPDSFSQDDPRLNEILAQYLQAVEAGESPDPEGLLREHPKYAEELRQFLADRVYRTN